MNQIDRLELDLLSEEAEFSPPASFRVITYDGKTQSYEPLDEFPAHSVFFANRSLYRSFLYFHLYGRSAHRVPSNAKLAGRETIAGVDCYVLEFQTPEGDPARPPWLVKIWVDPEKAFRVLKVESLSLSGDMQPPDTWTTIHEEFRQHGDIWFPTVSRVIHRWPGGKLDRVNTFIVKEAQFNLEFPTVFFKVDRKSYLNQSPRREIETQDLEGLLNKASTPPSYSPIIITDTDKILQDFPDAHLLHVVRNPWSAYADTKKRPVPLSIEDYMLGWTLTQYYAWNCTR